MTSEPELWTIGDVAEYIGAASSKSASKTLSRWDVKAVRYERNANGRPEARYDAEQVRAAHAARPGRGCRTDLEGR